METELNNLKKILRSLVVSSPTPVDLRGLQKDYKNMVGCNIPVNKFGYRDVLSFVKNSCQDCFVVEDSSYNPVLTLIVPDTLKHINNLVSRQRLDPKDKFKGKRRSLQQRSAPAATRPSRPVPVVKWPSSVPAPTPTSVAAPTPAPAPPFSPRPAASCSDIYSGSTVSGQSGETGQSDKSDTDQNCSLLELERRVVELVERHDAVGGGLLLSRVEGLYRDEYGHELPYRGHGVRSSCALRRLPRLVLVREQAEWRVWLASCKRAEGALPGVPDETPAPPPDCLGRGETFPSVHSVTADLRVRTQIEVVVSEVYSPTQFWVLRRGPEYLTALEDVMSLMNDHYERVSTVLGGGSVQPGQCCAALFDGDWHRTVVLTAPGPDAAVKVRYVDYGTVSRVSCGQLRPLPRQFAKLPVQAVRARLYGLRPPGGGARWSATQALAFVDMVRDRPLVGDVLAVDMAEDVLELILVDTSTAQDVCINMELVEAHHAAQRGPDELDEDSEYLRRPAFEHLESGRTLSLADIVDLHKVGLSEEGEPDYVEYAPRPRPTFWRGSGDTATATAPTGASCSQLARLQPLGQSSLVVSAPAPAPAPAPLVLPLSQLDCRIFLHTQYSFPQLALTFMLDKVQQALNTER